MSGAQWVYDFTHWKQPNVVSLSASQIGYHTLVQSVSCPLSEHCEVLADLDSTIPNRVGALPTAHSLQLLELIITNITIKGQMKGKTRT